VSGAQEWRVVRTADGSPTLVHPGHGEACHSLAGAWTEARERHVLACDVPRRLALGGVLRVLDVGTGLGLSLAALLAAAQDARGCLRVTTLELDPRAPREALRLAPGEPALAPWSAPLRQVAQALNAALGGVPVQGAVEVPLEAPPMVQGVLRLVLGDARLTLPGLAEGERFDVVFLDPFSRAVDPALWEAGFLREVARRMDPGSVLSTYSAAVAVRAGLLAAGLEVRLGPRVGTKREGTLAGPLLAGPELPPRLARRIARRALELS
jgi:tRNA U34 5-methylaminomethyl-2-thiouridine-forming methyltransferase MnmC